MLLLGRLPVMEKQVIQALDTTVCQLMRHVIMLVECEFQYFAIVLARRLKGNKEFLRAVLAAEFGDHSCVIRHALCEWAARLAKEHDPSFLFIYSLVYFAFCTAT